MQKFIPSFHFMSPEKKLTAEFCKAALDHSWHNRGHKSLLEGKNVPEIEQYSSGNIDMRPFKRMYKSIKREFKENNPDMEGSEIPMSEFPFVKYPAIPPKLNSVVALIQKIPFEVACVATDPLAATKREEDVLFLKTKPAREESLQDFANLKLIGKIL